MVDPVLRFMVIGMAQSDGSTESANLAFRLLVELFGADGSYIEI